MRASLWAGRVHLQGMRTSLVVGSWIAAMTTTSLATTLIEPGSGVEKDLELVQKAFQGEIRAEPSGLMANLLPFQIEGFSWMRHQEVEEPEIRGGILADEMGLG